MTWALKRFRFRENGQKNYYPEVPLEQYRKEKLRRLVDVLYGGNVDNLRADI